MRLELQLSLSKPADFSFQFHKGAIRTLLLLCYIFKNLYFNSIKVRLELTNDFILPAQRDNFNSIKVRLEPYNHLASGYQTLFQFHKGAIRTGVAFEFDAPNTDFNSIKVRLERLSSASSTSGMNKFQFHKGAIRTINRALCLLS